MQMHLSSFPTLEGISDFAMVSIMGHIPTSFLLKNIHQGIGKKLGFLFLFIIFYVHLLY